MCLTAQLSTERKLIVSNVGFGGIKHNLKFDNLESAIYIYRLSKYILGPPLVEPVFEDSAELPNMLLAVT